jgi:hypothetical protein
MLVPAMSPTPAPSRPRAVDAVASRACVQRPSSSSCCAHAQTRERETCRCVA